MLVYLMGFKHWPVF